jgi:hypothetical protein
MFSIRSIVLAFAAFATVASAIPMPIAEGTSDVSNTGDIVAILTGATGSSGDASGIPAGPGDVVPRGGYYPNDSVKKCSDGILVIVVKLSSFFFPFIVIIKVNYVKQRLLSTVRAVPRKLITMLLSASSRRSLLSSALFSTN